MLVHQRRFLYIPPINTQDPDILVNKKNSTKLASCKRTRYGNNGMSVNNSKTQCKLGGPSLHLLNTSKQIYCSRTPNSTRGVRIITHYQATCDENLGLAIPPRLLISTVTWTGHAREEDMDSKGEFCSVQKRPRSHIKLIDNNYLILRNWVLYHRLLLYKVVK